MNPQKDTLGITMVHFDVFWSHPRGPSCSIGADARMPRPLWRQIWIQNCTDIPKKQHKEAASEVLTVNIRVTADNGRTGVRVEKF